MQAGLQVFTADASRSIQIDADFFNLGLIQKGQTSVSQANAYVAQGSVSFTSRTRPMLAIRCSRTVSVLTAVSGSTYTFTFIVFGKDPGTVEWFLFDHPTAVTTYGLQVFNSEGFLVYDAGRAYMRVIDVISGEYSFGDPIGETTDSGIVRSYPSGRRIALMPTALCHYGQLGILPDSGAPGNERIWRDTRLGMAATTAENVVNARMRRYGYDEWPPNSSPPYGVQPQYGWLVIDVTGY